MRRRTSQRCLRPYCVRLRCLASTPAQLFAECAESCGICGGRCPARACIAMFSCVSEGVFTDATDRCEGACADAPNGAISLPSQNRRAEVLLMW